MIRDVLFKAAAPLICILFVSSCTERQQQKAETEAREAGRTAERKVDNAATTASVKAKLAADVRLSTITSINVDSNGDTVTLSGRVPTADDKRKAEEVARSVDGVARVINNLEVVP
jgi:hyperosmotically inducible periplasmic protein